MPSFDDIRLGVEQLENRSSRKLLYTLSDFAEPSTHRNLVFVGGEMPLPLK